jgi:hypothetical protein
MGCGNGRWQRGVDASRERVIIDLLVAALSVP